MIVIDRAGTRVRQVCGYCGRLSGEGHYTRYRKRNWLCNQCFIGTLAEAIRKHRKQVSDGVPFELRYIEYPVKFLRFMDAKWMDAIRDDMEVVQRKHAKSYRPPKWFASAMETVEERLRATA